MLEWVRRMVCCSAVWVRHLSLGALMGALRA